ncbi:MAG: head-tail connector protein [Pseudomonadota bacterium]
MASTLVTPPSVTPVSLAQAKAHLRITHNDEDTLIGELIEAATRFMADNDGVCCITQTWRYFVSDICQPRRIHRYPVSTVEAAIVYDADGHATTATAGEVLIDTRKRPAALTFDVTSIGANADNGADVDIVFGFGETAVDVPDTLRRAILILVAHWYTLRGDVAPSQQPVSVPEQYNRLVAPYRHLGVGG